MKRTARLLRRLADRIDHEGAPKYTHWTFTIERGHGVKFREDGKGCPVAYLGDEDYDRAHDESDTEAADEARRQMISAMLGNIAQHGQLIGRHVEEAFRAFLIRSPDTPRR